MALGIDDILIAVLSVLLSVAIDSNRERKARDRENHRQQIQNIFDAVKDQYGITLSQLDKVSESYGIKLSRLADASRGSARLSTASKIYRQYLQDYPNKINRINSITNTINETVADLNRISNKFEEGAAKGSKYSTSDITSALQDPIIKANDAIGSLGEAKIQKGDSEAAKVIDTSLQDKVEKLKKIPSMFQPSLKNIKI